MGRILTLLLVLWLGSGCFVFDELERGEEILDKHASRERREAQSRKQHAADAEAAAESESSLIADLGDQVRTWWSERNEPKAPERDPDDVVVRCELRGQARFTRKFDCLSQGGRVL